MSKELVRIQNIYWKRATVFFEYHCEENCSLNLFNSEKRYSMESEDQAEQDANCQVAKINVTNVEGEMLPAGKWEIAADNEKALAINDELLIDLGILDRIMPYEKDSMYIVFFSMEEGKLFINAEYVKKNPNPHSRGASKDFKKKMGEIEYSLFHSLRGKKDKKILFLSQTSDRPSENFLAVYNCMIERGMDKEYQIDFELTNSGGRTKSILSGIGLAYKVAGYNYIFLDDYASIFTVVTPGKDVKLTQLWHAGVGIKSVGYARFGMDGSPNPFESCHRRYTKAIVGNEALIPVYQEVFGIPKDKFIATGLPRLENFLEGNVRTSEVQKIYEEYPSLKGRKVILFAPTYRGAAQEDAYYDLEKLDLDRIGEMCEKEDSIFLIKWHPFMEARPEIPVKYKERIIDISQESLNSFMYVSDILVTDYSSCYYDYILLNKPVVFYLYDEAQYAVSRGVGESISDKLPGKTVRTMDELINTLWVEDLNAYKPREYMIDQCISNGDYKASDRIIDAVFGG